MKKGRLNLLDSLPVLYARIGMYQDSICIRCMVGNPATAVSNIHLPTVCSDYNNTTRLYTFLHQRFYIMSSLLNHKVSV